MFLDALAYEIPQEKFNSLFSQTAMSRPADPKLFPLIVYTVPLTNTFQWFHSVDRMPIVPQWEAWVVKRLFEESLGVEENRTPAMLSRLKDFQAIEGMPRFTFLLNLPESDGSYLDTVIAALNDPLVPEEPIKLFIRRKKKFFEDRKEALQKQLNERALGLISQALTRKTPPRAISIEKPKPEDIN